MSAARKDLLRNLIDQQLWLSKGKELDITGETELVKRLDEIRKQYNLESIEDLEKAAKEQGVSFEDFKANIRNQIITQEVMRQEVGEHIQMTPGEVERYYEEHKQDYAQPESERLSEILISTGTTEPTIRPRWRRPRRRPTTSRPGCTRAATLRSWRAASATDRRRPRAATWASTSAASLPKLLEDKTFDLQAGQYTDPILTRQGYIILKVVQHMPGGPRPFKDVEQDVEQAYYMSRMEPAIRDYLSKMRDEAFIQIKPGYTDTGATYAELHPSIAFSAYVPPAPKKKAKVERTRFRESTHTFRQKSGAAAPRRRMRPRRETSAPPATPAATKKKKRARRKKRHGEAGQERKDPLRPGAARDAAHRNDELGHGECGRAAGDGCSNAEQPANPLEPTAPTQEDTLQRARASTEDAEDERQRRRAMPTGACAAGCGRGCRPADAVGSSGAVGRHSDQEEEKGVDGDGGEDAPGAAEEERGRSQPKPAPQPTPIPPCAGRAGAPRPASRRRNRSNRRHSNSTCKSARSHRRGPGISSRARGVFGACASDFRPAILGAAGQLR